jgi:hypothetical protein
MRSRLHCRSREVSAFWDRLPLGAPGGIHKGSIQVRSPRYEPTPMAVERAAARTVWTEGRGRLAWGLRPRWPGNTGTSAIVRRRPDGSVSASNHQRRKRIVSLTQYYPATTLDGFIADPENSLDWLLTREREDDGPLNYRDFIADVGAMAMGSTTYEWILDHEFAGQDLSECKWPYDIPCLGVHAPAAASRPRLAN